MIKIISDEQRVFTKIRSIAVQLFGDNQVYDYTPPEYTEYPFIRIGEQFKQNKRLHKDDLNGDTQLTIHFWHNNERERGTLTSMMNELEQALITHYGVEGETINSRVIEDNSTAITLLHGILEINIKRYKER